MEKPVRVLVVDDDRTVRWVLERALADEGWAVDSATDGKSALELAETNRYSLVFMDVRMPVMDGLTALDRIRELSDPPETIVITAYSSMENTVEAMKLGAFDHVTKPFDIDEVLRLARRAVDRHHRRSETVSTGESAGIDRIIGDSPPMRELYKLLGRIAATSTSILVTGETGTGKDLFARAVHFHSARRNGPFVTVNCASIPAELLESELFGHEKGSFTGADSQRIGKCELADGGTLFLDEIGSLRLDLQAKLLTFLQRSEFERVGSSKTRKVDARVIAATNADLRGLAARGLFREDLYFRLMVVPVHIPPLRERREDIPALARYFVDRFNSRYGLRFTLTDENMGALESRDWPGNVRELENFIHRMVVLRSDGAEIGDNFGYGIPTAEKNKTLGEICGELVAGGGADLLDAARERIEPPLVELVLAAAGGNQSETAKRLGVSRNTLRKLMAKYGLRS